MAAATENARRAAVCWPVAKYSMPVLFTAVLVVLVTMLKLRIEQSPQLKTCETGLILV